MNASSQPFVLPRHSAPSSSPLHDALATIDRPRGSFQPRRFPSRPLLWVARAPRHAWHTMIAAAVLLSAPFFSHRAAAGPLDTWTPAALSANAIKSPNELIVAQGQYWAVGTEGKVEHSTDGLNWTVVPAPVTRTLTSIAYGNGTYVAGGYAMTLLSSANGTNWTVREENAAKALYSIDSLLFANSKFLALSAQASTAAVRISDNGTTWTSAAMNGTKFYPHSVAWGNGLYVAVGAVDGNFTVQTSPDGITWTRRSTSFTTSLDSVTWFNGLFIAGGTAATPVLATSPDGITWTKISTVTFPAADFEFWGIKVLNGRVFAFGDYGFLISSANGVDWVKHATGTTDVISGAEYNGSALYLMRRSDNPAGVGPLVSGAWAPVGSPIPVPDPGTGNTGDPLAARIVNLSSRAVVGTGDARFIAGFVISGTTPKKVLVRAVGPTLSTLGVTGVLADPQLQVMNSGGVEVAANDNWSTNASAITAATTAVGAFALPANSKDAAVIVTLAPGGYSVVTAGANGGTGVELIEVYDLEAAGSCKLVNISSRAMVGTGDDVAIAGFVVTGTSPRKLLVRGVGPTLATYGVTGALADPKITVFNNTQAKIAENDQWSTSTDVAAIQAAATKVGAFSLPLGTSDAALLITLNPGAYSVILSGATSTQTGIGLVEVYEVP